MGQSIVFVGLSLVLIAVTFLAALFVYYRPTVEYAIVDVGSPPSSLALRYGTLTLCGLLVLAGMARAAKRRRGGRGE